MRPVDREYCLQLGLTIFSQMKCSRVLSARNRITGVIYDSTMNQITLILKEVG